MRISDWSSDVCSSDLGQRIAFCEGRYLCIIGQAEYAARHVRIELGTIENEAFITAIHPDQVNAASRGKLRCAPIRSEEHTSELQSLMRISYAVFCLKKKRVIRAIEYTRIQVYSRTTVAQTQRTP